MMVVMGAASTSETSVNLYQTTWCNNPEDSHLHFIISSPSVPQIVGVRQ
jgi:hypothetical protein